MFRKAWADGTDHRRRRSEQRERSPSGARRDERDGRDGCDGRDGRDGAAQRGDGMLRDGAAQRGDGRTARRRWFARARRLRTATAHFSGSRAAGAAGAAAKAQVARYQDRYGDATADRRLGG